jgi:hypothetical protein
MRRNELGSMTVVQLRALAKRGKIRLRSRMKKSEIIEVIVSAEGVERKVRPRREQETGRGERPSPRVEEAKGEERQTNDRGIETRGTGAPPIQDLPMEYREDRIVLMARDPYWAFAYWEATLTGLCQAQDLLGVGEAARLTLRLFGREELPKSGGSVDEWLMDVEVYERIGNWYLDLGRPGWGVVAELGMKVPEGRFVAIARSNRVCLPLDGPSSLLDEEWLGETGEFEEIYRRSGGYERIDSSERPSQPVERVVLPISSPGGGEWPRRRVV